jgi:hypothetical protein
MSPTAVLLILGAVVIVAIFIASLTNQNTQAKLDRAQGVMYRFDDWALTRNQLLVGKQQRRGYPLGYLHGDFQMTGSINRDPGRYTITRFALLGPLAFGAKKGRNKVLDDRVGYMTITGPAGIVLQKTVSGHLFQQASAFIERVNQGAALN